MEVRWLSCTQSRSGAIEIMLLLLVAIPCSLVVVEKDAEAIEFCPVHVSYQS